MDIQIRQTTPEELEKIIPVVDAAFGQPNEGMLIRELLKAGDAPQELSLGAWDGNKPIGHILFSKIDIVKEDRSHRSIALAPMAVAPAWQKKGIGGMLIRAGLSATIGQGYTSVIVLGHPAYYPRFGFEPASKWGIVPPFEVPDEVFMGLELEEDALQGVSGVVAYAPAFSNV